MKDIPYYKTWVKIEPETRGWSTDQKFHIVDDNSKHLLLRIADISHYEKKEQEFFWIKRVAATGIPMSSPLEFGICNGGASVYSLLSWIEGDETQAWLTRRTPAECYRLGVSAGMHLKKIHAIAVPRVEQDAEQQMQAIFSRKLSMYRTSDLAIEQEADFLRYINQAFPCLHGIPQTFLHGDYHVGNMIVSPDDQLYVIDFNRYKFGDPVRDFSRLAVFSRMVSVDFARGQIDGYCGAHPTNNFFQRMAFYTAFDTLFSVLWARSFGEDEIRNTGQRIQMVWEDFDGFSRYVPLWYA
jgi:serine/threonine-protein kinase